MIKIEGEFWEERPWPRFFRKARFVFEVWTITTAPAASLLLVVPMRLRRTRRPFS